MQLHRGNLQSIQSVRQKVTGWITKYVLWTDIKIIESSEWKMKTLHMSVHQLN